MKNVLVFIHPSKTFHRTDYHREMEFLSKAQIDNSLAFGWKREDILVVTNFPYEYNGVRALVVPDETFNQEKTTVSKINAILALYKMGAITDELCWFHDFDALQNAPLGDVNLGTMDLGLTRASVSGEPLSTGVLFFSQKARDLFVAIRDECLRLKTDEEKALFMLLNGPRGGLINDRLSIMNISYNFAIRKRNVAENYLLAHKPIRVLHFHPFDHRLCTYEAGKTVVQVLRGDNSFGERLISDTLAEVFRHHGYPV